MIMAEQAPSSETLKNNRFTLNNLRNTYRTSTDSQMCEWICVPTYIWYE